MADLTTQPDAPEQELLEYQAVSKLAVISLILGLISALSLLVTAMLVIPAAAAFTGLWALYLIRRPGSQRSGSGLAAAGLVLGILYLSAVPTYQWSRRRHLFLEARQHADYWVELLEEGRLQEAHQLQLPQASRVPPGMDLDDFYEASAVAADALTEMLGEYPLFRMQEPYDDVEVEFVDYVRHAFEGDVDKMFLEYEFRILQDGQWHSDPLYVVMNRVWDRQSGDHQWNVEDVLAGTEPALN